MSVSNIVVVPVSQKLIISQLQISNSVKDSSPKTNSYAHSSIDSMKEIVINGPVKQQVLSNIFPVQFIYLQKLISTKAIKVNHGYDYPFYKVALTTRLHNSAGLLWLQLQSGGWVTLLGPKLDQKLQCAITSAIEHQQLLVTNKIN